MTSNSSASKGQIIGYTYSSPAAQTANRKKLEEFGCDRYFSDTEPARSELENVLRYVLRDGDVLVVPSVAQLAPAPADLFTLVDALDGANVRGVDVEVLTGPPGLLKAAAALRAAYGNVPVQSIGPQPAAVTPPSVRPKERRPVTPEKRAKVIEMARAGATLAQTVALVDLHISTVSRVRKEARLGRSKGGKR